MDNGGPAFPATHFDLADNEHGMTLRDYFAGQALAGLTSNPNWSVEPEELSDAAYEYADAMLKAREVKP